MGEIKLRLSADGGRDGGAVIEPYREATTLDAAKAFVEDRIKVLYAGCLAETLNSGKVDEAACQSCFRVGATQDFAKIREILYLLRCFSGGDQNFIDTMVETLSNASCDIILAEIKTIEALATTLSNRILKMGETYVFSRLNIEAVPEFADRFVKSS